MPLVVPRQQLPVAEGRVYLGEAGYSCQKRGIVNHHFAPLAPTPVCFEVSPLGGAGRGQGAQLPVEKTIGELICGPVFVLDPALA